MAVENVISVCLGKQKPYVFNVVVKLDVCAPGIYLSVLMNARNDNESIPLPPVPAPSNPSALYLAYNIVSKLYINSYLGELKNMRNSSTKKDGRKPKDPGSV